jgi:hypothetical protein
LVEAGKAPGKKVVKINVYRPACNIHSDPLDFNTTDARRMIDLGYTDAILTFAGTL